MAYAFTVQLQAEEPRECGEPITVHRVKHTVATNAVQAGANATHDLREESPDLQDIKIRRVTYA